MASTYSTNLKIELQATGENSGTWGTITNTNLGTALEQAIVGYGNPSYASDANLTLTYTDTNAAQAARALVLNVTSAVSLTATRELVVPTIQKQYIVQNNTTGSQSITVKTSAGTGITVPNGRKAHLYVDGTNVIYMDDYVDINGGAIDGTPIGASSASTGAFTTLSASGNFTLSGGTANGVLYLNGSKVATSGSAFVFDGTNVGIGTSSPDGKLDVAQAMTNGSTGAFTTPHLALTATSTTDTTGFVGMTMATSDNSNYGFSYGALRSSGGAGDLVWRNHFNSASGTELLRLTGSGNLGLGVTPSAWGSGSTAFQVGNGAIFKSGSRSVDWITNGYYNGSNYIYNTSNAATYYRQYDGVHSWYNAASGTAGNAITFTQAMTLDSSGNLGVGQTSPAAARVHISAASTPRLRFTNDTTGHTDNDGTLLGLDSSQQFHIYNYENTAIYFGTNNIERARITAGGTFQTNTAGPYGINLNQDTATATNSSRLFLTNSSGGHSFHKSAGNTVFSTGATDGSSTGTAAIIFNEYGIGLGSGNNPTSGIGIQFPATQSASSNANTLDDYEEGTFTPTISGSTSAGTGTYSVQYGNYTKIGNRVYIDVYLDWSAHTGTGNIRFTNLPFTIKNASNLRASAAVGYVSNIALTAGNVLTLLGINNVNYLLGYQYPTGGGAATDVPIDTAGTIVFSVNYEV